MKFNDTNVKVTVCSIIGGSLVTGGDCPSKIQ